MVEKAEFVRESNAIEDVYSERALDDSLEAWRYLRQQEELSHETVGETHRRILENRQPEIPSQYRNCRVYVGDRVSPRTRSRSNEDGGTSRDRA